LLASADGSPPGSSASSGASHARSESRTFKKSPLLIPLQPRLLRFLRARVRLRAEGVGRAGELAVRDLPLQPRALRVRSLGLGACTQGVRRVRRLTSARECHTGAWALLHDDGGRPHRVRQKSHRGSGLLKDEGSSQEKVCSVLLGGIGPAGDESLPKPCCLQRPTCSRARCPPLKPARARGQPRANPAGRVLR
jgi:hypothetical protein